jgi:O-succinylbenzoic acid--CoA ligase
VIHLAAVRDGERIQAAFSERVLPFERARAVHAVESIPRSALGKVLRGELARRVGESPKTAE